MGVYEERAPPTTGMHWVSVIPMSALPIGRRAPADTPRRDESSPLARIRESGRYASLREHLSLVGFKMVNVKLVALSLLRIQMKNEFPRAVFLT